MIKKWIDKYLIRNLNVHITFKMDIYSFIVKKCLFKGYS